MADLSYPPGDCKTKFKHCLDVRNVLNMANIHDYHFNQKTSFFFVIYKEAFTKTKQYVDHHKKEDMCRFISCLRPIMKHAIPFIS